LVAKILLKKGGGGGRGLRGGKVNRTKEDPHKDGGRPRSKRIEKGELYARWDAIGQR